MANSSFQNIVDTNGLAPVSGSIQHVVGWGAAIFVSVFALLVFARILWLGYKERAWLDVAKQQFAAVVGLPASAIAALFVVLVLPLASGEIKVVLGPLKLEGAAAPIVFWLLCFLAIVTGIKMLWKP